MTYGFDPAYPVETTRFRIVEAVISAVTGLGREAEATASFEPGARRVRFPVSAEPALVQGERVMLVLYREPDRGSRVVAYYVRGQGRAVHIGIKDGEDHAETRRERLVAMALLFISAILVAADQGWLWIAKGEGQMLSALGIVGGLGAALVAGYGLYISQTRAAQEADIAFLLKKCAERDGGTVGAQR